MMLQLCRIDDDDEDDDKLVSNVKCHYLQAEVSEIIYDLSDCVYVKVSLLLTFLLEHISICH